MYLHQNQALRYEMHQHAQHLWYVERIMIIQSDLLIRDHLTYLF